MDAVKVLEFLHDAQKSRWLAQVDAIHEAGLFCKWMTSMHPDKLSCDMSGGFLHGSYNLNQKVVFSDGTTWLLRLPLVGHVADAHADEKIAMEVEVLKLIHEKTDIPVAEVKAWGRAADSPLGLGPFIVEDFLEGESLSDHFRIAKDQRLLRKDVDNSKLEPVYRQLARFSVQLFQLDFDSIGSVPTTVTKFTPWPRPLTFKVHDILQTGGVDTFGRSSW